MEEKKGTEICFETYAQVPERVLDTDYMDAHLTRFFMKREDARTLLEKIEMPCLEDFLKEYTFDWSEQLYMAAKESGLIISEEIFNEKTGKVET